jgi:hypothetical protein
MQVIQIRRLVLMIAAINADNGITIQILALSEILVMLA